MDKLFNSLAKLTSNIVGKGWTFIVATLFIIVWFAIGPWLNYSPGWQNILNFTTTIITFLIVFLIQNTQNRDSWILHLKIDELIRSNKEARNSLIDLDNLSDEQLAQLEKGFKEICSKCGAENQAIDN